MPSPIHRHRLRRQLARRKPFAVAPRCTATALTPAHSPGTFRLAFWFGGPFNPIEWWQGKKVYHVGVVDPDNRIYESNAIDGVTHRNFLNPMDDGVHLMTFAPWLHVEDHEWEDITSWFVFHDGHPYDFGGVAAFPLRLPWLNRKKGWFCSEALQAAIDQRASRLALMVRVEHGRVQPGEQYCSPILVPA